MSNLAHVARTEFAAALAQIANERKIPAESILEAIRQALVSAFRKQFGSLEEESHYFATVDADSGESRIFKAPATKIDEETGDILEWDEKKSEDVTPAGFGRIAAQTAKQVILQKIRESEKDQIISDYSDRVGTIVNGQILRMDGRMVIIDIGRGQGIMPPEEQMRGEFYRMNARITVLIKDIRDTHKGKSILVSRADKQLVAKLFEREVPEVASGSVEIVSISREAGVRTKLAVRSTQDGVDPVGSCVGQRGVRVQEVIRELNNEKIDIIPYNENMVLYLKAALAPAENLTITINEEKKTAVVVAPNDQLSLAIGRGGQNVRLAAKLSGYKITVQTSAGHVESQVTGEEEYEIDTLEGLSAEARDFLVFRKLTTISDIARFKAKWFENEKLTPEQQELLLKAVEAFEKEESKRAGFGLPIPEAPTAEVGEGPAEPAIASPAVAAPEVAAESVAEVAETPAEVVEEKPAKAKKAKAKKEVTEEK